MPTEKYPRERLISSEYVFKVLKSISENEEGNYATQIADEVGKGGREEATRVCRKLHEEGLIEEGKRTKAQYYEINFQGFSNLFRDLIDENLLSEVSKDQKDTIKDYLEEKLDSIEGIRFIEEIEDSLDENIDAFVPYYTRFYLNDVKDSNIYKMLLDDFFFGLNSIEVEELPVWLSYLKLVREETYEISENPAEIILKALEKQE